MNWYEREAAKRKAQRERLVGTLVVAAGLVAFWGLFFYALWGVFSD